MGKFSIETVFKAIDKMSGPMNRMVAGMDRFTQKAASGLARVDSMTAKAVDGIKAMSLAAAGAGVAAGAVALNIGRTGADFEQAITNVGAVSLMTRDQIADLEKKALELGASTKFSATEVAQAMEMMGRAGFTNAETLSGVGGILAAAAAEGAGLEETASNVSNVLKGMGLATSESGRVADVLTLASARTNSSISSLGESLKNVASTARTFGISFEDTTAAVALLQDVGIDASEAGSSLNTMLTMMAAPSDQVAKQMKTLGVSFKDAKGNMLPFTDVLKQLSKSAQKSGGNMEQVAFFADLLGLRGSKAAGNLKSLFEEGKVEALTKELQGAAGSAQKMADIRMDTLMGDIEKFGGSIDSLKIKLFQTQSGPLRDIVQDMGNWVDANAELIASGFVDFIKESIPLVKGFGEGVKSSFKEAGPVIKAVTESVGKVMGLFGDESIGAQANAYFFGRRVTQLAFAFVGFTVAVKLARVATIAWGVATKAVSVAMVLWTGAVKMAQAALATYRIWQVAGTASTLAMSGATAIATGNMVAARIAAFATAPGFAAMGAAAAAAAIPIMAAVAAIGALLMAADQAAKFADENGGMEGVKGWFGIGTDDWGFEGVDEVMNRQAKARAAAQSKTSAVDTLIGPDATSSGIDGLDAMMARYGIVPQPALAAGTPSQAMPQGQQPQGVSPWDGMNPNELKGLFTGAIKIDIKDPGQNADVKVDSPNKTLAPTPARSGRDWSRDFR